MGSSFGHLFRVTTFGESHGAGIGAVVEGCPPGLALASELVQAQLDRRRPGQSSLTTARKESDRAEILSGLYEGKTLGTPIAILIRNQDVKSADYDHLARAYRPSHADLTYQQKYGHRDHRGGGRASARETAARVAAGAIASELLRVRFGVSIVGYVRQVGDIIAQLSPEDVTPEAVEQNEVRCPDPKAAAQMKACIEKARNDGDSIGGVVECVAHGVPAGLGEPVFDKLDADLAKGMLSIPACKAFELGSGLAASVMRGSEHNDPYYNDGERIRTRSNHAGGILGGISNGEAILLRAAFKPPATIMRTQESVDSSGQAIELEGRGRHDPCVLPRAVPVVEAMTALVLADHALRQTAVAGSIFFDP